MLSKLPSTEGPTRFPSQMAFNSAMNGAGERPDGPVVLAIWAGRQLSGGGRGRHEGRMHSHLRGQVMCIEDGLMQVRTQSGSWLVPAHRAVWIPPGHAHASTITGVTRSWNVFLSSKGSEAMPPEPCVLAVNLLMHELVLRATAWREADRLDGSQRRLALVLIDELRRAPRDPLHLPMPKDRRLLRIANAITENPSDTRGKDEWAAWAGMSERTMSRQFQAQVRMSFVQWRQQALLIHALERLLTGESVAAVADSMGYATPSNFITMFRKAMGYSPAHYVARLQETAFGAAASE